MAFWDDAKKKVLQAMKPRQQEEQIVSNRADGGFSGYQPKVKRQQTEQMPAGYQPMGGASGFENMVPMGVDMGAMQQFRQVGGQTGPVAPAGQAFPQGMQPQPGMPQQSPMGRTGYQQPVGQPRPQAQFQGQPPVNQQPMNSQPSGPQAPVQPGQAFPPQGGQQPVRPGFGQTAFQPNPAPQQPPRGFTTQQPQVQQMNGEMHAFPFTGDSYVVDGNAYKLVFRVAQITGVPSCFRVIEFMYNNEAVIVNAEQITDLVEADRCMDLIFGAACAMKQRLMRVSGKQIYLITPPQVYVAPFDSLRRAGMADIERRWPGALQSNMQPQQAVNNVQPMPNVQSVQQPVYNQPRQEDFAGSFGRRAAHQGMQTNGYTDYGGFGMKQR